MSLSSAMSSALTALQAQATALSVISNNISNADTTAYKTTEASFESMIYGDSSSSSSSGGVLVSNRANVGAQGTLASASSSTDLAISGSGFFVVKSTTSSAASVQYTRDGEFSTNSDGILENNGNELMGWKTDADGKIVGGTTEADLTAIDTSAASTYVKGTSTASIAANLPANAATGDTYTSSMTVYDSLGTAATSTITWAKTGTNTWTATFSDPVSSTDSSTTLGTVTSSAITVNFNSDGTLESTSPSPATLTIGNWTTGASDSSISLNLGTSGKSDGLTQQTSSDSTLSVTPTISQDGVKYGKLSSVAVETDGTVRATYSNGASIAIYKVAVATFTDQNSLTSSSNGIYSANAQSGTATLNIAGQNGAGKVEGGELESSTTDTNTEFSLMIEAQHAYSAASQVISAANSMFTTLINLMK
ncbi:MAG: flagellar hook protein FlgE [Ancalomicrobiaceae bacterium]|nr:flagellar hook protein FlgE [Ancalomicrobiaceae bacterium]